MLWELSKIFNNKTKYLRAFNTLEVMTAVIFISVLLTASYSVYSASLTTAERSRQYTLAQLMAQNLLEQTVSKRNEDWNSMVPGTYYLVQDPNTGLTFANGDEVVDEFTRQVVIATVKRDSNNNIVQSGGTTDPDTIKATATVTWTYNGSNYQVQLVRYLTNWGRF